MSPDKKIYPGLKTPLLLSGDRCTQRKEKMPLVNGLVPSRFLVLTAHLVIVITIFWSRENNVRASLPLQCTPEEYNQRDTDALPAAVEIFLFISVFGLKKKPL
ncbi:transmembrane protein 107 isoform X4 [Ahaetulla prasina]|uniref:transmembrane protein 107 isoform X4 n=1 Tax=Ahaetulla prasina TaxID=499056 RepID=UPI0026487BF0|nr:transmembrane protein 107 isoform X4 [Ahaetulla prasina]